MASLGAPPLLSFVADACADSPDVSVAYPSLSTNFWRRLILSSTKFVASPSCNVAIVWSRASSTVLRSFAISLIDGVHIVVGENFFDFAVGHTELVCQKDDCLEVNVHFDAVVSHFCCCDDKSFPY